MGEFSKKCSIFNRKIVSWAFPGIARSEDVENYQTISSQQVVARLLDISKIEIVIQIPENAISIVPNVKDLVVQFDSFPNHLIPAQIFVMFFLILMAFFCLFFTLQDRTISITTIFGSLSVYLFIGFVFAYIYLFMETVSPMSFSGLNVQEESQAVYFSFITLTTVGFGEIVPLKPIAQTLVWLESFTGQSYLAIIIGQLVGRYVADHMQAKG